MYNAGRTIAIIITTVSAATSYICEHLKQIHGISLHMPCTFPICVYRYDLSLHTISTTTKAHSHLIWNWQTDSRAHQLLPRTDTPAHTQTHTILPLFSLSSFSMKINCFLHAQNAIDKIVKSSARAWGHCRVFVYGARTTLCSAFMFGISTWIEFNCLGLGLALA